jgi:hypothetical protein
VAEREDVLKLMGMLSAAYPRMVIEDATTELYVRALADLDGGLLEAAALEAVTHYDEGKGDWFPSVARLRHYAAQVHIRAAQVPDVAEAWAEVKRNVENSRAAHAWSHPLVKKAIDQLGGLPAYGMAPIEDEPSWRARYFQTYETLVRRQTEAVETVPAVRAQIAAVAERLKIGEG